MNFFWVIVKYARDMKYIMINWKQSFAIKQTPLHHLTLIKKERNSGAQFILFNEAERQVSYNPESKQCVFQYMEIGYFPR